MCVSVCGAGVCVYECESVRVSGCGSVCVRV